MTAQPIHILYIPGLGDGYDGFRRSALRLWSLLGVKAELVSLTWYDGGSFDKKYALIQASIDTASKDNARIIVIGESAGASLALIAAERNAAVAHVMTLCGVTQPNTPIAQSLRRRAPALDEAVGRLSQHDQRPSLQRTSLRAFIDSTVGKRYSIASGADERIVWSVGHLLTIVLCLTVFSPYMVRCAIRG